MDVVEPARTVAAPDPTGRAARKRNLERVISVLWKVVSDASAAASSDGHVFGLLVLLSCVRNRELLDGWRRKRTTHSAPTNFQRRRQVPLHERLVDFERPGDVVEPIARIVGWEKGGHIDIDP